MRRIVSVLWSGAVLVLRVPSSSVSCEAVNPVPLEISCSRYSSSPGTALVENTKTTAQKHQVEHAHNEASDDG